MMKNSILFALLTLSAALLTAQPVITNQDLLQVGDVVATQPCLSVPFHPGDPGADRVWDFTALIADGPQDTTFYLLPAGTPYAATYPSSNIVGRFGDDQYGYYQTMGDQLLFWGQTDPSSTLVLTDPAVYFQSPVTYGTFLYDTIAGSLSSGPLNGALTGRVYFEGDGYGTLQLPGVTYTDVLRVKTTTIAVVTIPFFGAVTDSVFNYSWYKLGIASPVLEMIDDTQWANGAVVAQTRYVNYFRSITSATAEAATFELHAYPNPAATEIRFSGLEKPARVVVRNAAGQIVLTETVAPDASLPVSSLAPGLYFCSVFPGDGRAQTLKITVP